MKEKLKESLNKIGWDIKGHYPNEYITDLNGERTNCRIMQDELEILTEGSYSIIFGWGGLELYELEHNGKIDCVGLKDKGIGKVFIQFYNHNH